VNKGDHQDADIFAKNLKALIHGRPASDGWTVPVIKTIATTEAGLGQLLEAILKHGAFRKAHPRKFHLLAEKAYLLIREQRMKDIYREQLVADLEREAEKPDFNLYRYVSKFLRGKT